jgi:proteasome accessory factor A
VLEALVLDPKRIYPLLADPLAALTGISRDPKFRWEIALESGQTETALAVQRAYLSAVREICDLSVPAKAAVVADWDAVLNDLERDVMRCRNRLDWVAKLALVREFQKNQQLPDDDPWLQSLDLEYHRLDMTEGLYYGLEQSGVIVGVPDELVVRRAVTQPPTTRATVRGKCIQKFAACVTAAQWDHITLQGREGPIKIPLVDLFSPEDVLRCSRAIDAARSPEDLRILT